MKRRIYNSLFYTLALAAIVLSVADIFAAVPSLRLPVIGAQAQFSASLVELLPDDTTFVNAAVSPGGCTFLSYIDRAHGNRLHVVQDAGDHLVDVPLPAVVQSIAIAAPGFVAPGDKQADGALTIRGGVLSLYYTSRAADDPTGPFRLWRLSMPLPGCQG